MRSSRGAPATPPAPREAAPSTTARPGLVGRAGRRPEAAERRRGIQAVGATSSCPGCGGAASRLSRGAPATPPALREAAPSTATRVAAVRQTWTRGAVAERWRRLSRIGGCCRGCGDGMADPRTTPAATGVSGRPGEVAVGFGGRGGATATRGERPVGIRCCWFQAMVLDYSGLTLSIRSPDPPDDCEGE